jgi:hypothetical protein
MVLGANLRGHITRAPETTEMAQVIKNVSDSQIKINKNDGLHFPMRNG